MKFEKSEFFQSIKQFLIFITRRKKQLNETFICTSPCPSAVSKSKPVSHAQRYDPCELMQICSQLPLFSSHSLTSSKKSH